MDSFKDAIARVILDQHRELPVPDPQFGRKLFVAYSGGSDSTALLNALSETIVPGELEIIALHVNHGLNADSALWEQHCRVSAQKLGVDYYCHRLPEAGPPASENLEAWAREQRYAWFRSVMSPGDFVATAHHIDDQLETFLLRLFRGSGPSGLSAIKACQAFGRGYLIRPMLAETKQAVDEYVRTRALAFVEDPSNACEDLDRNYLRHSVIPSIRRRWPHAANKVLEAAEIQQQVAADFKQRADALLEQILEPGGESLSYQAVRALEPESGYQVIRHWCERRGLGIPERRHFIEIEKALYRVSPKASLELSWKNAVLRYYQGVLYLSEKVPPIDPNQRLQWDLSGELKLPHGSLKCIPVNSGGLDPTLVGSDCEVAYYRHRGERCHPAGRQHSQTLKKLFQSWRVPPWQRQRQPILWVDGQIAAVIPYCVCSPFATKPGEPGVLFEFISSAPTE